MKEKKGAGQEPSGEPVLIFDVQLKSGDLWIFSMYHANSGLMGIFNVIFTAAALFLLIAMAGQLSGLQIVLALICATMFTVWQPLMLYFKAMRQSKQPAIRQPMRLSFGEEGLLVEQNGQSARFAWEQMARMDRLPKLMVIYMDRVHAYLLPSRITGAKGEALCAMAREKLPKERRRRV